MGKEGNIVVSKSSDCAGENINPIQPKDKFGLSVYWLWCVCDLQERRKW